MFRGIWLYHNTLSDVDSEEDLYAVYQSINVSDGACKGGSLGL